MAFIDQVQSWAIRKPSLRVFTLLVRVSLAVGFLPSGLVKIMDEPFTTLPMTDPVGFFFAGFFSAHAYYRFIGVAQLTAAALLLIPQTATLGAFLYLPIIINIFCITVAIGHAFAGTRIVTGAMTLAVVYLLFWDWDRWKHILPENVGDGRHGTLGVTLGLMMAATLGFRGIVGLHLALIRHESFDGFAILAIAAAMSGLALSVVAYRTATNNRQDPAVRG